MLALGSQILFSQALSSRAFAQADDGDPEMRIQQLENQLRQLTGQNEELQHQNQVLQDRLRTLQGGAQAAPGQVAAAVDRAARHGRTSPAAAQSGLSAAAAGL